MPQLHAMPKPRKQHDLFECYLLTCLVNGKRYVGIASSSAKRRWIEHKHATRKGAKTPLHNAIRRYGAESFKLEVVGICSSWDQVCLLEQAKIIELATLAKDGNGYNLSTGGEGPFGVTRGEETRAKLRAATRDWLAADPTRIEHLREISRKQMSDPKNRELSRLGALKQQEDPELRDKCKQGLIKFWSTPEAAELRRSFQREVMSRPGTKENLRAKAKAQMKDPVNRDKSRHGALKQWKNPEFQSKMKLQMKKVGTRIWKDPAYRERMKKLTSKPLMAGGQRFESVNAAAAALGIAPNSVCYRLASKNFPDHYYLARPRYVLVDGVRYESVKAAAKALGITHPVCLRRLNSDDFPNYKLIDELNIG